WGSTRVRKSLIFVWLRTPTWPRRWLPKKLGRVANVDAQVPPEDHGVPEAGGRKDDMAKHLSAEQITKYQERTLPPGELLAVDSHLGSCAECQAQMAAQSS